MPTFLLIALKSYLLVPNSTISRYLLHVGYLRTELNILWAVHQVHHSSENYNLTVGFRLSALQKVAHFGFYQPLALLGIPLPAVLVHTGLNYLFQFWIHNTFIGRLGPLEYVIATPSFHRVHHGKRWRRRWVHNVTQAVLKRNLVVPYENKTYISLLTK